MATLSFLEKQAGNYKSDNEALLTALDCLTTSRELWKTAVAEYATTRREAKSRGERTPRPKDPNPSHTPDQWYGAAREAARHALTFRASRDLLPTASDDVTTDVLMLVKAALKSPVLTTDQNSLLADLTVELRRQIRTTTQGPPLKNATELHRLTQLIRLATT